MAAILGHHGALLGADERDEAVWRLAAIVESSNDPIISKTLDGFVTTWNKAAERLFGYAAREMIGRPITMVFPPDRMQEETAILAAIGRGEQLDRYESIRRHKDGRDIPVSVTISPIKDANGNIIGASKIIRDLTEQHAQARRIRALQSQLTHIQRATELRHVTLALVHQLAQPITAISNYLNALRRMLALGKQERVAEAVRRIGEETERAAQTAQRIREYVKHDDMRIRFERLQQVIDEFVDLASLSQEGVRITTRIHPMASMVKIDKAQIHQVLFQILSNAIEAMENRSQRELALRTRPADGGMLEISIADRGPGLPDEVRRKLFQPFVTTKPTGLGVGLWVCQAIVQAHGGRIWAEDNQGGGSVFKFTVQAGTSEGRT
jgi:two-component system sensor kinase FixL